MCVYRHFIQFSFTAIIHPVLVEKKVRKNVSLKNYLQNYFFYGRFIIQS